MDSAYQKLQSNPFHKDLTHYGPYYPGNVTAPPQMFMNPPRPAPVHGCWPWGSNYGYGSPAACQGCCNHSYWPPHYAWGSPYFNVPPYHFPGSCHPYPIQYMTPSGYSVEPRYEYEKIPPGVQHCCGCPHHPLPQKEQRGVRIEEEEPDGERGRRKIDDSMSPFQFSDQPNPIVWLPPGYGISSNNESKKESRRFEKPDQNRKIVDAEQPGFLNGWYPLDLSKFVSSKHGRDGERNDGQLDDDVKGRFPFPVVWMPYKPDQKEKEDHNVNGAIAQPRLGLEGSCDDQNLTMNEEKSGGQTTAQERGIPVMKVAQHGDQENLKNASGGGHIPRLKDIPVKEIRQHEDMGSPVKNSTDDGEKKKLDNDGVKKSAKNGAPRKSPSPPRSSKLPPVCLRVDPLPKRKSAKGRSRSPSPPGEKQQPDKTSNEASGVLSSSVNKKLDYINQEESKQGKGTTKNVEVDGKTQKGESVTIIREPPISISVNLQEAPEKAQTEKNPIKDNGTSCKVTKPDDAVVSDPSESAGFTKVENPELVGSEELVTAESKKKLSEKEAAVIIQSVYRGFDVRRWEPIKKLKQIANVRDLTAEVKHLIQSLESSSSDSKSKSKQKTIIGETIMSLLLKLDTIQGLHPSIREIRKSVVRELVNLQEKLDSMKDENPETGPSQESVEGHKGDPCLNQLDGGSKPESLGTTEFNRNEVGANAAGENCTNKEQGSAPPTTEGDRSDVQNETSMSKEDHEGLVLEQSYVTSEVNPVGDKANGKIADEVSECSMGKESAMYAPTGNDKEASKASVDEESSKDRRHKNLAGQSSELPLLQVDSGEVTLEEGTALTENAQDVCDDHSDGELSKETSVPNPTGENGEKVAAESFMTQESAAELFEDMNNEVHVNDEISMLKKHDQEDLILHESPEVPPLNTGSSHATDSVPGETDAGEGCDICAQESPNHMEMEFESSTLLVDTVNRETDVNVVDAGSETRESNLSKIFDSCKFEGTLEDETRITGGVPGDCAAPQPENTIAGVFEDLEASETVGSCSRKDSSGNTSHEELGEIEVNNAISEVSPDSSAAHGMDNEAIVLVKNADEGEPGVDQIEPVNCTDNEAIVLVKKADEGEPGVDQIEPANCTDSEVIVLVKKADEGESGMDQIEPVNCTMSEKSIEVEPKEVHACKESATPDGVVALSDVVEQEDPTEKNRKLMEENERLREVMGELMRSGKEQVRAITTLSRRVKDLEKRLSRKKKVKVKQHPKATTGSVKPIDGC